MNELHFSRDSNRDPHAPPILNEEDFSSVLLGIAMTAIGLDNLETSGDNRTTIKIAGGTQVHLVLGAATKAKETGKKRQQQDWRAKCLPALPSVERIISAHVIAPGQTLVALSAEQIPNLHKAVEAQLRKTQQKQLEKQLDTQIPSITH